MIFSAPYSAQPTAQLYSDQPASAQPTPAQITSSSAQLSPAQRSTAYSRPLCYLVVVTQRSQRTSRWDVYSALLDVVRTLQHAFSFSGGPTPACVLGNTRGAMCPVTCPYSIKPDRPPWRASVCFASVRSHLWSCMWLTELGRIASLACWLGFVNGPCWWGLVPLTVTRFDCMWDLGEASGICLHGGCQPFSWLLWCVSCS